MLRLIHYLKPYTILILLTIALLFVQANADLALPDYLSRIVNVGIQQGGVPNAVALAISQNKMEQLLVFMTEQEQAVVLSYYTLIDQNSPDYEEYLAEIPALAETPVYVRNDMTQEEIDQLNPIMAEAWVIVSSLEQLVEDPSRATTLGPGADLAEQLAALPPETDIFALLGQLPPETLSQMSSMIEEQFAAMGESMVNQIAIAAVRAEYEALGINTTRLQTRYILVTGGMMLLISLVGGACMIATGLLSARTAAGAARDIRRDVFEKVENFSNSEFDKFSTASLITRSTNDVTQVQMVIFMTMRIVFFAPIIGIGGVIRAMGTSASMWWIIAVTLLALLSLILIVFWIAFPKFTIMQELIDRLNLVTRENLSGMMVIRAFNKQTFESQRFDKANRDLTDTSLFISRVMVTLMPVMMLIMNVLSLLIIWVGAQQIAEAKMQVGDMMAFMQYTMQIVFAFLMLSMMFIFLPRAAVSGGRIADVLETELTIIDPPQPQAFQEPFTGRIEFRNVTFRYPNAQDDVLHDISFTAEPGQTTAFIGSTGCGKSTVVNLIPRFYDVTDGAVLVNGVDVRLVKQSELRDKIGYIPQKGMLFSGTIESNLLYADKNASDQDLRLAVEIAQASEFIQSKPEGMATEIAQGGVNVSGGQKQRLAIARALVKKPPIYIFDDSFSALDYKTDSALRKALKEKTGESTVLVVTQRVATIKNVEQIIVLDDGRVVGMGKHHELLENCETYRQIAFSQLSKEELS